MAMKHIRYGKKTHGWSAGALVPCGIYDYMRAYCSLVITPSMRDCSFALARSIDRRYNGGLFLTPGGDGEKERSGRACADKTRNLVILYAWLSGDGFPVDLDSMLLASNSQHAIILPAILKPPFRSRRLKSKGRGDERGKEPPRPPLVCVLPGALFGIGVALPCVG